MATPVVIRSREQILGNLVRKYSIKTDVTSYDAGSDIVTLFEGIAESISQAEASALKILENIDVESLEGTALQKKAESIRLPNGQGGYGKKPALQASGPITIGSAFQKISSKLYAGKPAPFAGSNTLFVENASGFPNTGSVYVGRGTLNRFEGAIPYSSAINNGSFWTITLSNPLTKDHLLTDSVTVAQGGDRTVGAGSVVQIPANSDSVAVSFTTTQDLLIPDGESEGSVNVVCSQFGSIGNALAGAIKAFTASPFTGATVSNNTTFRNGQSIENDEDLRQRIKNYPSTLSRGTEQAIKSAIQGAIDPDTGRSIQSSVVQSPVEPGDYARVFIDDGTGLEPSFDNQPSELLLKSASGQETRFRTAQFPITAAIAEGSEVGPFALQSGMTISFQVDEIVETYTVTDNNYKTLSSATAYEIIRDLNSQTNIIGFRSIDEGKRIVAIDLGGKGERLKVLPGTLQEILGLPTAELRPIFLYEDLELLSFRGKTATLETRPRNLWNITEADLVSVPVLVDKVVQTITITDDDFAEFTSAVATATVFEFAEIFSRKIAGVKFTVSGQIIVWTTYNTLSPDGKLQILPTRADGTSSPWIADDKVWLSVSSGGVLSDTGATKDYDFNRFTGEISLLAKPKTGATLEIATRDTRALIRSTITDNGLYALSPIISTIGNSKFIAGFDGQFAIRTLSVSPGVTVTPTKPAPSAASNVYRLTSDDTGLFFDSVVGDYFYLLSDLTATDTILPTAAEGFYRIMARGFNTFPDDVVVGGPLGASQTYASLPIRTNNGSKTVIISQAGHGLKTGDLIKTTTSTAVGGISSGNLSVTNSAIVVTSTDTYTYQVASAATSDDTGTLTSLGINRIKVTHENHGLSTGSNITVITSTGFGGISSGNLSVANTSVIVIDSDHYYYRAAAAVTSTAVDQVLTTVTILADTWVEFEVSTPQDTTWTPMIGGDYGITKDMLYIFKSDGATPQLVDFGDAISSASVDDIVAAVNAQIAGGEMVKVSPQQLELHSGMYNEAGTVAVLAVIGNASSLFAAQTDTANQAHVAYSGSQQVTIGAPVIESIVVPSAPDDGYATRTYLFSDRNITNVINTNPNPVINSPVAYNSTYPSGFQHVWLTGRASGYTARVYNNQTTGPYTGVLTGGDIVHPLNTFDDEQSNPDTLNRYANFGIRTQDLPVNNHDALVVEMDLSPIEKTINVPMAKQAEIMDMDTLAGSGKGQVISFRLLDPDDSDRPFFDSTSVYKDFDFVDFKLLTKSVILYREDVSDRALIVRSVDYGATAQLNFSIRFPSQPNQADIQITHSSVYSLTKPQLNLIAVLPSNSLIAGSLLGSGQYKVTSSANATLFDWRISSPNLNATMTYIAGNVLSISGTSNLSGAYEITAAMYGDYTNVPAVVTNGSPVVTITQTGHGFESGDLINVTATTTIGGISPANLTVSGTSITVVDANTFRYTANASATSGASGIIDEVVGGNVTVKSPGSGGLSPSGLYDAALAPIKTWALIPRSLQDVADAINAYLPNNPIATAEAIGTNIPANPVIMPTYNVYPNVSAYTGSDLSGAFDWHIKAAKYAGHAGIWQYNSSSPSANAIKATVQSDDSIYPTAAEASGTSYSPVGEQVQLVPTNAKTLADWMNFKAVSSLGILSVIDRVNSDNAVQISSTEDGGDGAVSVTGVSANTVNTTIIGNAADVDDSTRITVLSAAARSLVQNQFVKVDNSLSAEILRTYRNAPIDTSSTTVANTATINTYFRPENSVKYIKVAQNIGRLVFLRNGMGASQAEPLAVDNMVQFTNLGNGLVQVTTDQGSSVDSSTGKASARVGDMMYIQTGSPFPADSWCKELSTVGRLASAEYLGYPVVYVIDDYNIIVIAPNITSFTTTVLTSATDLIFMPAVWNEKNIRTNHQAGAKYTDVFSTGEAFYLTKKLGNGLVSVFLQNNTTEATDNMLLDVMSVNTDDYAIFGTGFDPANQGTYRIVAHNGRNHMVVYNPNGGRDELVDLNALNNGGQGDRKWRVGPLNDGINRALRIISADSVRVGDFLRISTPSDQAQWFNDVFIGSWKISAIGYQAYNYTGDTLPHSATDGAYNKAYLCPYIDFEMTNAPVAVTDTSDAPVDAFLVGANAASLGFTESIPFSTLRMVGGHAVSNQNEENRDLYLLPRQSTYKMSNTFGTEITALNKIGFEERTFQGIDGYKVYSGLIRQAHRIIDGLPSNTILFPGVKAAGAIIECETPLIRSISVALQVRPADGVTLNSISELVKSTVSGYINTLGIGQPVVLSQILRIVQSLPGVYSVKILSSLPVATDDRIVVSDVEKAFILNIEDITVG